MPRPKTPFLPPKADRPDHPHAASRFNEEKATDAL
jgi:hypothetical protein